MVVGTIAVAVVFPPEAPAGIGAAGEALTVAKEGAEAVVKVATTLEKLKMLFEKLKPGLEKVGAIVEAVQKLYEVINKLKQTDSLGENDASLKMPSLETPGSDAINMGAHWDAFDIDMHELFAGFKDFDIDGKNEYSRLIYNTPVRGKAVLACQNAVAQAFDEYYRLVQQQYYAHRNTERLRLAIASLQGDPRYLRIFKLAMLDRLIDIRSWITMDLQSYVAAYAWYSLDPMQPIQINPVKPLQDLLEDAAKLQSAVAQADERILAQEKLFRISASGSGAIMSSTWREGLAEGGGWSFIIPVTSAMFAKYDRVRISRIRCYLPGATPSQPDASIAVSITSASTFVDRAPSTGRAQDSSEVAFVLPATQLTFEYIPQSPKPQILMDGEFTKSASYVQPSPFTTWTLRLLDGSVDLATAQDLVVEMQCQVTVRY